MLANWAVVTKLLLHPLCSSSCRSSKLQMSVCKTLFCASLSSFKCTSHPSICTVSLPLSSLLHHHPHAGFSFSLFMFCASNRNYIHLSGLSFTSRCYTSAPCVTSVEEQSNDTVQHILPGNNEGVSRLTKMERREFGESEPQARWFPYLDRFRCGNGYLTSSREIVNAVSPIISEARKERFGNVVRNRRYSVCLVVEGLCDFGNVSAAFRWADALGVQSVHEVSCDANKRC